MSKYKHLLFDVDGTLVDSFEADMSSLATLLDRHRPGHGKTREDLIFAFGIPGRSTLRILGFSEEEIPELIAEWVDLAAERASEVKLFDGVIPVLSRLKELNFSMGIITSRTRDKSLGGPLGNFIPEPVRPYISHAVCAGDTARPKPYPDPILHYMELTGAKREEILFIGDAPTDLQAASAAGVDFALALWGYHGREHLFCSHYPKSMWEVLNIATQKEKEQSFASRMHDWAREINAIGQIGLAYVRDRFDEERYKRIQEIACEMAACYVDESFEVIKEQWCTQHGYKTPQVDTRVAVFDDHDRLLMVREALSGQWNMPGGWCDENLSLGANAVKEVYEEAGLRVFVKKLIAVQHRELHNTPQHISGCIKTFIECSAGTGEFVPNTETTECRYFSFEDIKALKEGELRVSTNTLDQIFLCMEAHKAENWVTVVE